MVPAQKVEVGDVKVQSLLVERRLLACPDHRQAETEGKPRFKVDTTTRPGEVRHDESALTILRNDLVVDPVHVLVQVDDLRLVPGVTEGCLRGIASYGR